MSQGFTPIRNRCLRSRCCRTCCEIESVEGISGITWGIGGPDLEPLAWDPAATPHVVCVAPAALESQRFSALCCKESKSFRGRKRASSSSTTGARTWGHSSPTWWRPTRPTPRPRSRRSSIQCAPWRRSLPGADVTPAELAARSWWQGPDIYLAIDDLDLVSEIALAPLLELLPHARDIGLHLLIARKSGGIGRALYSQFLPPSATFNPQYFFSTLIVRKAPSSASNPRPNHLDAVSGPFVAPSLALPNLFTPNQPRRTFMTSTLSGQFFRRARRHRHSHNHHFDAATIYEGPETVYRYDLPGTGIVEGWALSPVVEQCSKICGPQWPEVTAEVIVDVSGTEISVEAAAILRRQLEVAGAWWLQIPMTNTPGLYLHPTWNPQKRRPKNST